MHKTSDFLEAVVFRYTGHKIVFVDKSQKRAEFYFEHSFDTDQILEEYRKREMRVEPQSFYLCEREIKNEIYKTNH